MASSESLFSSPVSDPVAVGTVRHRLRHPVDTVGVVALAGLWFQGDVRLRVATAGLGACAADPAAADRLRGAFGQALMAVASAPAQAGQPCPWSPPCTLDILWGDMGPVRRGVSLPRPFVLGLDADGDDTVVLRLSVIGFASDWTEAAADALVRACRAGLSLDGGPRRPLEPLERTVVAGGLPPLPDFSGWTEVLLLFHTPFQPRRGEGGAFDPLALLTGLSRRAEGMARWHDAALTVRGQALADAAAALSADLSGMEAAVWARPRTRGRQHDQWRDGLRGLYRLRGPADAVAEVMPLLWLGQAFGAGSHAGLGQGRYQVVIPVGDRAGKEEEIHAG